MPRRSSILASDADREHVAERLRQAAAEGRILAHELEERVARALRARTYGELDQLVDDLPRPGAPARRRSRGARLARSHPLAAVGVLVAVTLVFFVLAAVVVAGLFAFSGLWLMLALIVFARRGPWSGGPWSGGSGRRRYGGYGARRGRYPHWVR